MDSFLNDTHGYVVIASLHIKSYIIIKSWRIATNSSCFDVSWYFEAVWGYRTKAWVFPRNIFKHQNKSQSWITSHKLFNHSVLDFLIHDIWILIWPYEILIDYKGFAKCVDHNEVSSDYGFLFLLSFPSQFILYNLSHKLSVKWSHGESFTARELGTKCWSHQSPMPNW